MKRPIYVTITAVLSFLVGALQVGMGLFVVSKRHDAKFLADADASSSKLLVLGVALAVIGLITLLMAIGLMRGSRLARGIVGFGLFMQGVAGVYTLITLKGGNRVSAVSMIVGSLVALYMLFGSEKARNFFAK